MYQVSPRVQHSYTTGNLELMYEEVHSKFRNLITRNWICKFIANRQAAPRAPRSLCSLLTVQYWRPCHHKHLSQTTTTNHNQSLRPKSQTGTMHARIEVGRELSAKPSASSGWSCLRRPRKGRSWSRPIR